MTNAQSIANSLRYEKWHFVHKRVRTPLYQNFLVEGISLHKNPRVSFPHEVNMLHVNGEIGIVLGDFERANREAENAFNKNHNFLLKYIKDSYRLNKKIDTLVLKLEKKKYAKVKSKELMEHWQTYAHNLYQFGAYVAIPLYIESYLERELKKECDRTFGTEASTAFQVLTTPMKLGVIQKEEESLLNIAIQKNKGKNVSLAITKHLREFAWIKNNKFDGSFYTKTDIEARVDKLVAENPEKHLVEYLEKIKNTAEKFKTYRKSFTGNKRALAIIDTLQESIYFRSWRTERYYRNAYFLMPFFAKTAETLGLANPNDLFYLTANEIIIALEKVKEENVAINERIIEERKKGYILQSDTKTISIFSGKDAEYFNFIELSGGETTGDIKGQTAYPGTAKGPARLVLSVKDLSKIQDGDILVSLSTTPDYVPVLKKVRAIVTEEGGVLSHASVISRELHIPCVIGTKTATKILKDGQMVEVDAGKGIVKVVQ